MSPFAVGLLILVVQVLSFQIEDSSPHIKCRTQPGDRAFPTKQRLSRLNSSVDGRLVAVVPSAQFCKSRPGGCSDGEWEDSIFRSNIPGAMLQTNWEQDYTSDPPSLCVRNSSTCGQGSVPVYAVNATTAAHIQAGVRFAQKHNLKVAIKASGHDLLGRSTAKGSLLLWTRYLETITFHDSFKVGGKYKGSAVTTGSGVGLHTLYQACKAKGKIYVGGVAANVVPAGGYVQGAGHSPLGPLLGLAADNTLEFQVVLADGRLVTVNEVTNPDLFWAMRGGGAGSWGVIISATFRTFPTFDVALHQASIALNSTTDVEKFATLHAQHIFDWDDARASQSLITVALPDPSGPKFLVQITTYFPKMSLQAANASIAPFLEAVAIAGFSAVTSLNAVNINDAVSTETDSGGTNGVVGSRLVSSDVYRQNATAVGVAYRQIFEGNMTFISEDLMAGGRVSENANIDSAIHPKWRTAKTQMIIVTGWSDSTPPDAVAEIREDFTRNKVAILDALAGPGSASYSNEGDVREPAFQTTFFGDYKRLSAVKHKYDPRALFIVGAGVGSEKWDADGLCRVARPLT